MRDKTNLKNRIKGLLGIILSVCTLVSMSGMNVYAVTFDATKYGEEGTSVEIDAQYAQNGDNIEVSGGSFTLVDSEGYTESYDNGGATCYRVKLAENKPIPEGKLLKLVPTRKSTTYSDADFVNLKIEALLVDMPYIITFHSEGAEKKVGQMDSSFDVSENPYFEAAEGKVFKGWSYTNGGEVVNFADGYYSFESPGTLDLYAVWQAEAVEPGTTLSTGRAYSLSVGTYSMNSSFSIGDGFTYSSGSFYVPTAKEYTFN